MVFHEITKSAIDHGDRQPARHRLRPRRRRRDPPHPRPAVRLRGVAGPVAAGQPRPVGRARPEPLDPPDRRTRARTHRVRVGRLLGHRPPHRHRPGVRCQARRRRRHEGRHRQGLRRPRSRERQGGRPRRGPGTGAGRPSLDGATFTVRSVEEKPYKSSPKAPFMTSTLQQEGGRKLRLSSSQVMRVAQGLYERGFITYMRTDNGHPVRRGDAGHARGDPVGVRAEVPQRRNRSSTRRSRRTRRRPTRRSAPPRRTARRSRSRRRAQQPGTRAVPADLAAHARVADGRRHRRHRERPARPRRRIVPRRSLDCEFAASGTTITFPGYRAVYVASKASDGDGADKEALLPPLAAGEVVPVASRRPHGHTTSPPARYTEASLVKRLEELEHR